MTEEVEVKQSLGEVEETPKVRRPRPPPYCRFFNTSRGCRQGEECPFRHVIREKKAASEKADVDIGSKPEVVVRTERKAKPKSAEIAAFVPPNVSQRPSIPQRTTLKKTESGQQSQIAARKSEIIYFKRRYPNCNVKKEVDDSEVISFKYEVTDPDWVFDVKSMKLSLRLLPSHPITPPTLSVPAEANRVLPEVLRKHVERSINDAILQKYNLFEEKDVYEIVGKLIIRYIDRNIRSMFIEGLRKTRLVVQAEAAGISLVVPSASKRTEEQPANESSQSSEADDEELDESLSDIGRSIESLDVPDEPLHAIQQGDSTKLPIDVILVWQNSSTNIASIAPVSLVISTNCTRCKTEESHEVSATSNKPVQWRCVKCAMAQSMLLKACLVHENSSVLCELDCRGCRPLDCVLLQSHLTFVCLACNREDNAQMLNYGQPHKSWCRGCHAACEFLVSAIRFRGDFSRLTTEDNDAAKNLPKIKKKTESHAVVTPGGPLPDIGTCKHYKKSYRWFRFPCCGKVFPCDVCHEEANMGHEMKLANRMICGHCSHEQIFQNSKPCTSCNQNIVRSRSHFWEGGKGCRDKKAMSKNDVHKFKNNQPKIVPKKIKSDIQ